MKVSFKNLRNQLVNQWNPKALKRGMLQFTTNEELQSKRMTPKLTGKTIVLFNQQNEVKETQNVFFKNAKLHGLDIPEAVIEFSRDAEKYMAVFTEKFVFARIIEKFKNGQMNIHYSLINPKGTRAYDGFTKFLKFEMKDGKPVRLLNMELHDAPIRKPIRAIIGDLFRKNKSMYGALRRQYIEDSKYMSKYINPPENQNIGYMSRVRGLEKEPDTASAIYDGLTGDKEISDEGLKLFTNLLSDVDTSHNDMINQLSKMKVYTG